MGQDQPDLKILKLRNAVEACRHALERCSEEEDREAWIQARVNLGLALWRYATALPWDDAYSPAAEAQKTLLAVWDEIDEDPEGFPTGDIAFAIGQTSVLCEDLEQAMWGFGRALQEFPHDVCPRRRALAQLGFGVAAVRLSRAPSIDVYEARDALESALEVITREEEPDKWAEGQRYLGCALLMTGSECADPLVLVRAIDALLLAREIRTREQDPSEWGRTTADLGLAYRRLATFTGKARLLGYSAAMFDQALQVLREQGEVFILEELIPDFGLTLIQLAQETQDREPAQRAMSMLEEYIVWMEGRGYKDHPQAEVGRCLADAARGLVHLLEQAQGGGAQA